MRTLLFLAALGLLATGGAAPAQPNEDQFHDEVIRRLDRIERMLERIERDSDRGAADSYEGPRDDRRQEVVATVNLLCGANCGMAARTYCRRIEFRNGVALRTEQRNFAEWVTRVRCFN